MATSKTDLAEMRRKLDEKMQWKKKKSKKSLDKITKDSQTARVCPHCGVKGKGQSMYRWHFSRCPKRYESLLLKSETTPKDSVMPSYQDQIVSEDSEPTAL
jgi:hypothetical protein